MAGENSTASRQDRRGMGETPAGGCWRYTEGRRVSRKDAKAQRKKPRRQKVFFSSFAPLRLCGRLFPSAPHVVTLLTRSLSRPSQNAATASRISRPPWKNFSRSNSGLKYAS